ncbi:glycine-rich cell wall structural protein 1 [Metarhizium album ARSEF 1941]|uniref:Glycine-rich cell wall structural protein 1 n=1 Tax=Metarhizium album (strain ARSEF 1941) TaxID=1081103 RepID=A0A0B2X547_METAS|nr:glycine-rich cell wall structural protein 1 [Metarhizium album ARSEF 1941]KHO00863.1 glycine-rich cell wall structural protein 1 [Metarhizium album ARSEF 1941]
METVSNIAQSAVKAVWGDGTEHEEPISGVQGDVSKGEPYDGGNADPKDQDRADPESTTAQKEGRFSKETQDTKQDTEAPSTTTESGGSTARESRQNSAPKRDEKNTEAHDSPRPLAAVAKENGGDAGNLRAGSKSTSAEADAADADENPSSESKGTGEKYVKTTGLAADGGNFDAVNPGAGREADQDKKATIFHAVELYRIHVVLTPYSRLPGLMQEKGVDHEGGADQPTKPDSSSSASGSGSKDDKPSLKEKIKDKLHMHKS